MATASPETIQTEADILLDVLTGGNLKSDTAQWLLTLQFSDQQQARMLDLAERNNAGTLLPGEKDELFRYVRVGDLLSVIHLKARIALRGVARSA